MILSGLLLVIAAYFLGSIPTGFLMARGIKGIDIRKHGSQSTGATNVFRVVGKTWGVIVMLLDAIKGYLAVKLPVLLSLESLFPGYFPLVLGLTAILGHTFPVWLQFKGGKGVASSLGVFLAVAPLPTGIAFGFWWIIFLSTRILSVASLGAAVLFPIAVFLVSRESSPLFGILFPVSLLLAGFIFYTHRANIRRLARGEEKRLF